MGKTLTDEQRSIVVAEPEADAPVKVSAFAGTGKTSTLVTYAELRPKVNMLYLAYNKANQEEAAARMPHNVRCRTIHSLAFASVGKRYRHKLKQLKVGHLMQMHSGLDYKSARAVLLTLNNYIASSDPEIDKEHLPRVSIGALWGLVPLDENGYPPRCPVGELIGTVEDRLLSLARESWEVMCSPRNDDLPMTHDGYLKIYQLRGRSTAAQLILVDEAQDLTPCQWSIVEKQHGRKVIVGDPHQSIYQWRGAVDALRKVETSPQLDLPLTMSFRFGDGLASVATDLLRALKGEHRRLRGNPDIDTIVKVSEAESYGSGATIVCRSNAKVFELAGRESEHRRLGFVGGAAGYRLYVLRDVLSLFEGQHGLVKDPFVRSFPTFDALRRFAEGTLDVELMYACRVVKDYGSQVRPMVNRILASEIDCKRAGLVFSTVHKAKGMEWENVFLGHDLADLILDHYEAPDLYRYGDEEANILYVALTRGTNEVTLSSVIREFIDRGRAHPDEKKDEPCVDEDDESSDESDSMYGF